MKSKIDACIEDLIKAQLDNECAVTVNTDQLRRILTKHFDPPPSVVRALRLVRKHDRLVMTPGVSGTRVVMKGRWYEITHIDFLNQLVDLRRCKNGTVVFGVQAKHIGCEFVK